MLCNQPHQSLSVAVAHSNLLSASLFTPIPWVLPSVPALQISSPSQWHGLLSCCKLLSSMWSQPSVIHGHMFIQQYDQSAQWWDTHLVRLCLSPSSWRWLGKRRRSNKPSKRWLSVRGCQTVFVLISDNMLAFSSQGKAEMCPGALRDGNIKSG